MNQLGAVPAENALHPLLARELEPCLWYPERLVWPNSWAGHIPFAFWLTRALRPRVLVELGVHTGNSYAAFCQAVKLTGIPTACFGVDTWQGDEHAGLYDDSVYNELSGWHDARYGNFSRLIRSTFDEAVEYLSPGSIDLLHIDGLHTYEAVRHDFETWLPRLSNRAVVLFHDTNVRDRHFGVWRFWQELAAQYPSFEFLHGHGLGVLGVGADLPHGVTALFDAARVPEELRRVRDFFTRLGTPLMRDIELGAAEANIARAAEAERAAGAARQAAEHDLAAAREATEREAAAARDAAGREAAAAREAAERDIAAAREAAERDIAAAREAAERDIAGAREAAEREVAAAQDQAQREAAEARAEAERAMATAAAKAARTTAHARLAAERESRHALAETRRVAEAAAQEAANARAAQAEAETRLAAILGSTTWRSASRLQAMVTSRPRLRRYGRRTVKLVWWTVSLQLFARLSERRSIARAASAPSPAPGLASASSFNEPLPPAQLHPPAPEPVTLHTHRIGPAAARGNAPMDRPLVVCLSHVPPYPPRAGNEYRIQRVLAWLDAKGWDVVFLYCPLDGEEPDEAQLAMLRAGCDNLVYVHRNGQVRYSVARPDLEAVIAALDGRRPRDVAGLTGEASQPATRLLDVMRNFSADALIEVMCAIDEALAPKILFANYVFMTRGLPLLRGGAVKIVDTHDLFSTKSTKITPFGIADGLAMSEAEEAHLLSRADLVLAIQPDEAAELRRIAPGARVLTVGVDMKVDMSDSVLAEAPIVLLVASGNPMNAKGLRDFLRFAWPRVLKAVPGAELHVVGSVGKAVPGDEPGVLRLGLVDDLGQAYGTARTVINPAVAGTGIKIKTLEALAHLRPLVTWPSGVDGVSPELRELCECVTDWYAFSEAVIRMLTDDDAARRVSANRERIAELLSPDAVFAELDADLASLHAGAAE